MTSDAYLPVEIDARWFLLRSQLVREVIGAVSVARIPHPTRRIPGVFAWKGRALPIIDLAEALGLPAKTAHRTETSGRVGPKPRSRTIVVDCAGEMIGLPVDRAREVLVVAAGELRPPHVAPVPFSRGELTLGDELLTALDLGAMVDELLERGRKEVG